jgi:predicted porin
MISLNTCALKTISRAGIVAAILAAASSAFAQSSVQLYGLIDDWVGVQKFPGGHSAAVDSGGGMSTSYWGLKGAEVLGENYKAIFTVEGFFQPQNGQYGSFPGDDFFSRNAYVGIEAPWGTVTAGRLTTPLFISTLLFNPFHDSFAFSPMIVQTYLGLGTFPTYRTDQGTVGGTSWSNALSYASPNFNGLSATAMYGLGDTTQNGAKKWSGQVLYVNGPLGASAVYQYENFNGAPADLSGLIPGMRSQSIVQLDASYDMKLLKFFGQYMYTYNDRQISSWHVSTVQGGVSVPVGVGTFMASYAFSRDSGGFDLTNETASIGYDYPLSQRTDVYAAYMYDHFTSQSSGNTYGVGIRSKF